MIGFYRVPEPIDESTIRVFQEEMKKNSIIKGIMVSSSSFTRKALVFAENRPIDFVNKENTPGASAEDKYFSYLILYGPVIRPVPFNLSDL